MKRILVVLFALVLVFSLAELIVHPGAVQAQLANAPWPMFRHDLQQTGRSPFTATEVPIEKWSFATGGSVTSSPAIGADGTVYVASEDDKLYAINSDGSIQWSFATPPSSIINWRSSPAIGADGTIYVCFYEDKLYAVNPNGSMKWNFPIVWGGGSSPAIGGDGTIYVGSFDDKRLYAINPNGSLKWFYTTGWFIRSSPAIGADGTIYISSQDDKLYAINPNGSAKWSFSNVNGYCSPAIGVDGTIYIGADYNKLYAINPDGSFKWSYTTGDWVISSPAIGGDGTIYVGSYDNNIHAVNPDGSPKWSFTTGAEIISSPAIGGDGTIYIGSNDSKLYAIGEAAPAAIEATLDLNPDILNLKSKGKWITCYIELPEDYDVEDIDVDTVELSYGGDGVSAAWGDVQDGALMVKFDRAEVQSRLLPGDEIEVAVSGEFINGTPFEGRDTIRVIE